MFILRTDNLFLLPFSAISSFKSCVFLTSLPWIMGGIGTSVILQGQSNTALISEGKFSNFQF